MDFSSSARLVRRGAELVHSMNRDDEPGKLPTGRYAGIGLIVVVLTAVIYYVALIKIRYVVGSVIGSLAIIEEPGNKMIVEIESLDEEDLDKKASDRLLEPEIAVVHTKPTTRTIRTAAAHMRAVHGRRAGMRGFGLWILLILLKGLLTLPFSLILPGHGSVLPSIAAEVALAKLRMVWVHHVISSPESGGKWYRRKESFAVPWTKIAPVALLDASASHIATVLPSLLVCIHPQVHALVHKTSGEPSFKDIEQVAWVLVGGLLGSLVMVVLVYVPAHVTFIRVAASLLPEQHDTFVNFDRTFGGRVAFGERVGMKLAWTSFNWEQRRRYLRLLASLVAILISLTAVAMGVLALECYVFLDHPSTLLQSLKLR